MTNMVLMKQEQFSCENRDVDILMCQFNGKVFFNATKVWNNFGKPETLALDIYLRTDSARKLMLQMYSNLNGSDKFLNEINGLTKNLFKKGFKSKLSENSNLTKNKGSDNFKNIEGFLYATNMVRLKQFNPEFEDGFVHATKGRNGSTFLCYNLFLDYCTHLSTQLKIQVFEIFGEFGDLSSLEGQEKVDALQRKTDEARAKLPVFKSAVVSPTVRGDVSARTKALQRAIHDLYYSSGEKPSRNMYSHIHNQINCNLFGMSSENMQKLIALSQSSKNLIRDYMTEKAIRLLESVEATVYVFLVDCYGSQIIPDLSQLNSVLARACESVLSFAYIIKNDFHLLQNAIERDYDFLVKNADCVKDQGVIARPDEICAKENLMPLSESTKQIVDLRKTDNSIQQNSPKDIKQLSMFD